MERLCKIASWATDQIVFVVPKGLVPGASYDLTVSNKMGSITITNGFKID